MFRRKVCHLHAQKSQPRPSLVLHEQLKRTPPTFLSHESVSRLCVTGSLSEELSDSTLLMKAFIFSKFSCNLHQNGLVFALRWLANLNLLYLRGQDVGLAFISIMPFGFLPGTPADNLLTFLGLCFAFALLRRIPCGTHLQLLLD